MILAAFAYTNASVLHYEEQFDYVRASAPAKSYKITCKTRVDLSEGLVDNSQGCDISSIMVYNHNHMWVGSLDGIEGGSHHRYADYDTDRYKGKGQTIAVDYEFYPEEATEENKWAVSCPKGMKPKIEDDYWTCKTPYVCDTGMYAVDEFECAELPQYAHRNKTTGFTCNKGMVQVSEYECQLKAVCNQSELYDDSTNSCLTKPLNSHWVAQSNEWECDKDFIRSYDVCVEKATCDTTISRYDENYNSCVELPLNAHWIDSTSPSWSCDAGFTTTNSGGSCEKIKICTSNQRYDHTMNICLDPPEHSSWSAYGDNIVCDDGYVQVGYHSCEEKAICEDYHYNSANNSCYTKPEHSHWVEVYGDEWECNAGYHKSKFSDVCYQCTNGTQFDENVGECVDKPSHSHWISEGQWDCDDGYVVQNNLCELKASCGWFERYDSVHNTCVSKPSHSHWTYQWYYDCDNGYSYDNVRQECYDIDPIRAEDVFHFGHDIGGFIGGSSLTDNYNETQSLLNSEIDYNAGLRVGNENIGVLFQGTIGVLYTSLEYKKKHQLSYSSYDENETITMFTLLYGGNIGIYLWKLTADYSYLFATKNTLDNLETNTIMHKFRVGITLADHWNIHLAILSGIIKTTAVYKQPDSNSFNVGISYRF